MAISAFEHPKTTERIGLRDLARLSGYSYFTVSKVINNHGGVSDKTRRAILELAEKYHYRPNAAARSILRNKTFHVGVMLRNAPDKPFQNPSALEMIVGINNTLASRGYILSLIRIGDVTGEMAHESRVFREHALDGMIVSGNIPSDTVAVVRSVMPCCLYMDTNLCAAHSCIQQDEYYAGYTVASHLIAQGYRRLVWVGPDPAVDGHYSVIRRFAGLQAAVCESSSAFRVFYRRTAQKLYDHQMVPLDFVREHSRPDTAVVCYGVGDAMEWSMLAMGLGLVAPGDYGISACEDSQLFAEHWPGLTRMSFSRLTLGQQAGEMFLRLLQNADDPPPSRTLRGELVVGQTTRRILPSEAS